MRAVGLLKKNSNQQDESYNWIIDFSPDMSQLLEVFYKVKLLNYKNGWLVSFDLVLHTLFTNKKVLT